MEHACRRRRSGWLADGDRATHPRPITALILTVLLQFNAAAQLGAGAAGLSAACAVTLDRGSGHPYSCFRLGQILGSLMLGSLMLGRLSFNAGSCQGSHALRAGTAAWSSRSAALPPAAVGLPVDAALGRVSAPAAPASCVEAALDGSPASPAGASCAGAASECSSACPTPARALWSASAGCSLAPALAVDGIGAPPPPPAASAGGSSSRPVRVHGTRSEPQAPSAAPRARAPRFAAPPCKPRTWERRPDCASRHASQLHSRSVRRRVAHTPRPGEREGVARKGVKTPGRGAPSVAPVKPGTPRGTRPGHALPPTSRCPLRRGRRPGNPLTMLSGKCFHRIQRLHALPGHAHGFQIDLMRQRGFALHRGKRGARGQAVGA